MVRLTFEFHQEKLKKAGLTEDEVLADVRAYAKEHQVAETSFGVFEKSGEEALCLLMLMADKVLTGNTDYIPNDNTAYFDYLKKLELDDGDEKEDWVELTKQRLNKTETEDEEVEEEEEETTAKLTFEFNQEELRKAGLTEDEVLADVRAYAKEHQVTETSFGVFEKSGEEALCLLMIMADKVLTGNTDYIANGNTAYLNYLEKLELDDGDEKEDWVELTKQRLNKTETEDEEVEEEEEEETNAKLTFEFNQEELQKAGLTEDEVLADVRAYAKKHQITETTFGVFEKDGKDAAALLVRIGVETLRGNLDYMTYIDRLELDVDGEKEDCKESVREWLIEEGIHISDS